GMAALEPDGARARRGGARRPPRCEARARSVVDPEPRKGRALRKGGTKGRRMVVALVLGIACSAGARTIGDARNAAWLSVGHPGLGEYFNAGWGPFFDRCPQKKFWLGLIPFYGWPGYLQILSAIDAYHGRTSDNLQPVEEDAPRHHR